MHDKLIRFAQQLEDQHAPQHMTILMREAAQEMEGLRAALRAVDDEHGYGLPPETRQMIRAALGEKP